MFIKIELDDMETAEAGRVLSELNWAMQSGRLSALEPELVTHVGRPGTLYSDCRCDECAAWLQGKSA